MNEVNITSSLSKREKIRLKPLRRRNNLSIYYVGGTWPDHTPMMKCDSVWAVRQV